MKGCEMKKKELFAGCACGCFFSLVVAVVLPLALVVCSGVAAYGKYESLAEKTKQVREKSSGQEFETVWRWGDGDENSPSVARLRLDGEISHERIGRGLFGIDEEFSEHPLVAKIKAVEADSSFDGIWLDIDSPGGEVTLSDEIRHRLESFRKSRKGRFVFARFGAMACSGGYYVATAADCIMAARAVGCGMEYVFKNAARTKRDGDEKSPGKPRRPVPLLKDRNLIEPNGVGIARPGYRFT